MATTQEPKKRRRRRNRRGKGSQPNQQPPQSDRSLWDAARTDRLNAEHWAGAAAADQPINFSIESDLQEIVRRCRFEKHNNPMVEGVIQTHTIDLLGETGPSLQVVSDSPRYNRLLEEIWLEFWDSCTVDGCSGLDLMARYNDNDWTAGNSLAQLVDMSRELPSDAIIKTRLLDIAPYRLRNPWGAMLDQRVINGVRTDEFGRPTHYFIEPPRDRFGMFSEPKPIVADDILHWFDKREADQVVGFPRLASALPEIAELRDYDNQVLDAARQAADNGFLLELHPAAVELFENARLQSAGTTMSTPRRSGKVVPNGYTAKQMTAVQPISHYADFRHEKLRALGRAVHMPLLSILLSANKSNFSQSRVDLNVLYERGLNFLRGRWQRQWLVPLVKIVEREASLATYWKSGSQRFVLGRRPKEVSYQFGWEPLGHANPKDYATAVKILLELGLTSEVLELRKFGLTPDQVCRDRQAFQAALKKYGLAPEPTEESSGQADSQQSGQQLETANAV